MRSKGIKLIKYLSNILILARPRDQLTNNLVLVAKHIREVGVCTQSEEVCLVTDTNEWVSRVYGQFHNTSPSAQTGEDQEGVQACNLQTKVTAQQLAHLISLLSSVIAPAPLHYWALQRLWNKALQQERLQSPNKDGPGILEKASLVDLQSKKNLWSPDNTTSSKCTNQSLRRSWGTSRVLLSLCTLIPVSSRGFSGLAQFLTLSAPKQKQNSHVCKGKAWSSLCPFQTGRLQ